MEIPIPNSTPNFRSHSIRFFISSTFADMEIERNVLANVIQKLKKEYSKKQWIIDYVDLRWGVTKEAAADNKTMRVCLGEIDRCRRMSPKPNFIFLLGNRYGWIPLPEILFPDDFRKIEEKASAIEAEILKKAYRFDANRFPEGWYLRQPSNINAHIHEQEERILQSLFDRIYGRKRLSATACEIMAGALSIEEASEHVVGYIRELKGVPESKKEIYHEKEAHKIEALKSLKGDLSAIIPSENIFQPGLIFYDYYQSAEYIERFTSEMEVRIRKVIDREIEESAVSEIEYIRQYHIYLAHEFSRFFFGTKLELNELSKYILSDGFQYPRVIQGATGTGKKTFMSKSIVLSAKHTDLIVVARFIGYDDHCTNLPSLIMSIINELRSYFTSEALERNPYPMDIYDAELLIKKGIGNKNWLHFLDVSLKPGKYVIFIEGADRLKGLAERLNLFNQIKVGSYSNPYRKNSTQIFNLYEKLRVIVSYTKQNNDPIAPTFSNIDLLPLSFFEKESFVKGLLRSMSRTLSIDHTDYLRIILSNCDPRPIYLDLLGRYLATIESTEYIKGIPTDLSRLTELILSKVESEGMHNRRFIRIILSLIITSESGLDISSINDMLAFDIELVNELKNESFHDFENIGHHGLPPILTSRLYSDLEGILLHTVPTTEGLSILIRHPEIENIIKGKLTDNELTNGRRIQLKYFRKAWKRGNPYAVNGIVRLLCNEDVTPDGSSKLDEALTSEIFSLLTDIDFLESRWQLGGKVNLEMDFLSLISRCEVSPVFRTEVKKLRKFSALVSSLPLRMDPEMFRSWYSSVAKHINLNRLAAKFPDLDIMNDELSMFNFNNAIIANGRIIFSDKFEIVIPSRLRHHIERGNTSVAIFREDMALKTNKKIFEIKKSPSECRINIYEIQNTFTVLTSRKVLINHLDTCELISEIEFADFVNINTTYVNISKSGKFITINLSVDNKRELLIIDTEGIFPTISVRDCIDFKFSISEKFLWTTESDNKISRLDLSTGKRISLTIAKTNSQDFPPSHGPASKIYEALDTHLIFHLTELQDGYINHQFFLLHLIGETFHYIPLPGEAFFSSSEDEVYVNRSGYTDIIQLEDFDNFQPIEIQQLPFPIEALCYNKQWFTNRHPSSDTAPIYDLNSCIEQGLHYYPTNLKISAAGFSVSENGEKICVSGFQIPINNTTIIFKFDDTKKWSKEFIPTEINQPNVGLYASMLSPSGNLLACSLGLLEGPVILRIINIYDQRILAEFETQHPTASLIFSTDEKFVIAADYSGSARQLNDEFGNAQFHIIDLNTFNINHLHIPLSGERAILEGYDSFSLLPDNNTLYFDGILYDLKKKKVLNSKPLPKSYYYYKTHMYERLCKEIRLFTSGGLIVASGKGYLEIFDLYSEKSVQCDCQDTALAISPDASWLLMRTPDYHIYRTDLSLRYKKTLNNLMPENIINTLFHPIRKGFYAITRDGSVYFCNMDGDILSRAFPSHMLDAKVSKKGLVILREGCQVSLFSPSENILNELPEWEFDGQLMSQLFRTRYFST